MPKHHAVSPIAALSRFLGLSMEQQEQTNWCWAAVGVSVRRFYGLAGAASQCVQANDQLLRNDCCVDKPSCDRQWILDPGLFGNAEAAFSFATIRGLIDSGRVVAVRVAWGGGGTHFVCIDGYNAAGATPLLSIKDPWHGASMVPYDVLLSSYQGHGTWQNSYRT